MINATDIAALKPTTLILSPDERDATDWLHRMINLADTGTRIVYWSGETDVMPKGLRKKVFEFMMGAYENRRVRLFQQRDGSAIEYVAEVR